MPLTSEWTRVTRVGMERVGLAAKVLIKKKDPLSTYSGGPNSPRQYV